MFQPLHCHLYGLPLKIKAQFERPSHKTLINYLETYAIRTCKKSIRTAHHDIVLFKLNQNGNRTELSRTLWFELTRNEHRTNLLRHIFLYISKARSNWKPPTSNQRLKNGLSIKFSKCSFYFINSKLFYSFSLIVTNLQLFSQV